jgi:hypothetical protein
MVNQPIAPGMSVSVPIGKKNVIFKGWKKGETVTQDDIKRDTSGSSTSLRSLSDNTKVNPPPSLCTTGTRTSRRRRRP